ncbi:sensor histidine kinase [Mycolicibacterium fortuitum]|uniref:sensor histidine kinase n=1 Tax=Mycolicibacterium fortuitum TaxID=1766 RepID=UPI003AAAE3A5
MAAPPGAEEILRTDASRRHMLRRAAAVGLLMRNSVALIVALVTLADPGSAASPPGRWLLALTAIWSAYRIVTRSQRRALIVMDCGLVLANCAAIPLVVPDPVFYLSNSAPQAIAGTAVVSFAVSVPPRASLPITVAVAVAYAWGSVAVVGWEHLAAVAALYYFALQWLTAALIRIMVLRVAGAVDEAGAARRAAELDREITDAVHEYEREQLALLHDTAASTLLMVGQGAAPSAHRLADQARRDLGLLEHGPWVAPPVRMELVSVLRDCATHLVTPVKFDGLGEVWLPGDTGNRVIAAAREVFNNVDRHARASLLTITVTHDSVRFEDNGIGFDPDAPRTGHGVTDSILDRMRRAGGNASISSSLGAGTSTELSWRAASTNRDVAPTGPDPDQLIERTRVRYGLALTAYAVANLAFAVPHAAIVQADQQLNITLGLVAAAAVVTAVPGILRGRWRLAKVAAPGLLVVTIVQPALLPAELVGGYAHWAQSAIGWCVLPLLLALPTRRGALVLVAYWMVGSVVEFSCHPMASVLVNIGLGTASILSVQLFALWFNGLVREAAVDAQSEIRRHHRLVAGERIRQALRDEYQRRYARLVDNVVMLLRELGESGRVTDDLQRRSRLESRRLRALFDQAATFDHPLMQRLRRLVDRAEAGDVDVTIDLAGELPPLSAEDIQSLVAPLTPLAKETSSAARLVVTGSVDEVSLSIVCDGIDADSPSVRALAADATVELVTTDDSVWALVRQALTERVPVPPLGA